MRYKYVEVVLTCVCSFHVYSRVGLLLSLCTFPVIWLLALALCVLSRRKSDYYLDSLSIVCALLIVSCEEKFTSVCRVVIEVRVHCFGTVCLF